MANICNPQPATVARDTADIAAAGRPGWEKLRERIRAMPPALDRPTGYAAGSGRLGSCREAWFG
jgi:hypothetical protein